MPAVRKRADPARRAWPLFVIAIFFGLLTLGFFGQQAYRDVRITWFYKPAQCTIVSAAHYVDRVRNTMKAREHTEFTYQLQVNGRWYTATGFDNLQGLMANVSTYDFERGKSYPCWYDPWNPEEAVLRRQVYKPYYLGFIIPFIFLTIGGSMFVQAFRPVPDVTLEGETHGETLAVRLAPEITGRRTVGCAGAVAVVWTVGLVALVVYQIRAGTSDELLWLTLILLAIDVFIVKKLILFIRGLGVPDPVVEMGREPLRPGESTRLLVRQPGPARFAEFTISYLCYQQGQQGATESHRRQLVKKKDVEIARATNLSETLTIEIPAGAPVTLKEMQTIITWRIMLHRKVKGGGDADLEYVFRVLSAG